MIRSVNEEPEDTQWNKYMLQLTALKYSIYIEKKKKFVLQSFSQRQKISKPEYT